MHPLTALRDVCDIAALGYGGGCLIHPGVAEVLAADYVSTVRDKRAYTC